MDLTIKDIIEILPFELGFKDGLLERFDLLDPQQQKSLETVLRSLYDVIYNLKLHADEENMEVSDEVKTNKLPQGESGGVPEHVEEVDLQTARNKLQDIINQPEE